MPKSQVFLAWSGDRSRAVARALRKWLPKVLQNLEPWMSESDIEKGAVWNTELSAQLQTIKTGIVCLTPENLAVPWINFEAGALSKLPGSNTLTYLLELEAANVPHPLGQFQFTKADKEDTRELVRTLNKTLGNDGLESVQLEETFEKWWGELAEALEAARSAPVQKLPERDISDMLKEIVDTLRAHYGYQAKLVTILELLISQSPTTIPYGGWSGVHRGLTSTQEYLGRVPSTIFADLFKADSRLQGTSSTSEVPSPPKKED